MTLQSLTALQKHLNTGKHKEKLTEESAFDEIKRKWTEVCQSVGGGYVQGRTSGKNSDEESPTNQADFGWTLDEPFGKHKSSCLFSESKEVSPRRVLDRGGT